MKIASSVFAVALLVTACSSVEPTAIIINTDNCDYCKMTIADLHFASELITAKGKAYKFDDAVCMLNYYKENNVTTEARLYVCDFIRPEIFIDTKVAILAKGEEVASPMGGNLAAFATQSAAEEFAKAKNATLLHWADIH